MQPHDLQTGMLTWVY